MVIAAENKGVNMPPKKSNELPEMYIVYPDDTRVKIGKIQEIDISSDINESEFNTTGDYIINNYPMHTATFEVTWNPTADTFYLLIHGRYPSNNWRKMHGLPLKRRRAQKYDDGNKR